MTALGGALVGVALVALYLQFNPPDGKYDAADIRRLAQERIDAITPVPPLEPEIYALARPSVVVIAREGRTPGGPQGVGSGVVFDLNGSILTAYHVVAGAQIVTVHFFDGSTANGTIDQTQPERDLAIVKVRRLPSGVEPATLSGGVRPGDKVMALGAPGGSDVTATLGIISGLGRRFEDDETGRVLENLIQFDAPVNPGNSGGPLVDLNGRVVGIVTGRADNIGNRVADGIGFAVPIESAAVLGPRQD